MLQTGKLVFFMEGDEVEVNAGEMLNIPPHIPHKVEALEDSVAIDLFSPARDDWQRGDDAYLR
jgi:quercetin dioxygenase-like cupin family protein